MRVLLLADPNSSHTIKWVNILSEKGFDIYLCGFGNVSLENYSKEQQRKIFALSINKNVPAGEEGGISKLVYLKALPEIKKIIIKIKPDLVHSHYATSYGLLGVLSGFKPFVLSVWGADIFNFPLKSIIHKYLIKYILNRADAILSTSKIMAKEINKYISREVVVTPFGIDLTKFKPEINSSNKKPLVIGTIKTLEPKYGVNYLIEAFNMLVHKYPDYSLKLLIIGRGSCKTALENQVRACGIEDIVEFMGYIEPKEISKYYNLIDVYVSLSVEDSESFGVAVLEAMACEKPVVVSDVSGFSEIVKNDLNGFIVPRKNPDKAFQAIEKLLSESIRKEFGSKGREIVKNEYELNNNADIMIQIYLKLYNQYHNNSNI